MFTERNALIENVYKDKETLKHKAAVLATYLHRLAGTMIYCVTDSYTIGDCVCCNRLKNQLFAHKDVDYLCNVLRCKKDDYRPIVTIKEYYKNKRLADVVISPETFEIEIHRKHCNNNNKTYINFCDNFNLVCDQLKSKIENLSIEYPVGIEFNNGLEPNTLYIDVHNN